LKKSNHHPKSPAPDKVKRHKGYVIPVVFAIGIIIGFAITRIDLTKPKHKPKDGKTTPVTVLSNKLPFINPLVTNSFYKKINREVINGLDRKLQVLINQLTDKKGEEISVYFRDLNTDYYFGINEHSKFSPSSLMKVPVMIAVLKKAEKSPELLDTMLVYNGSRENQTRNMSDKTIITKSVLTTGESYSVRQLLDFMICDSDNEATIMLLDLVSDKFVHQVERELGFVIEKNATYFGDVISVKKYSSFFRTLYNASYLNNKMSNYALEILSNARYGFGIRKEIPSEIKVAHKYGSNGIPVSDHELKLNQLHHFAIVYAPDKTFLLGIMTRGDSELKMEENIRKVTKMVYEEVSSIKSNYKSYLNRDLQ
jgi:beta-lactamase class A